MRLVSGDYLDQLEWEEMYGEPLELGEPIEALIAMDNAADHDRTALLPEDLCRYLGGRWKH